MGCERARHGRRSAIGDRRLLIIVLTSLLFLSPLVSLFSIPSANTHTHTHTLAHTHTTLCALTSSLLPPLPPLTLHCAKALARRARGGSAGSGHGARIGRCTRFGRGESAAAISVCLSVSVSASGRRGRGGEGKGTASSLFLPALDLLSSPPALMSFFAPVVCF